MTEKEALQEDTIEVEAIHDKETKRMHRFVIGDPESPVQGGIYIKKEFDIPSVIHVYLKIGKVLVSVLKEEESKVK